MLAGHWVDIICRSALLTAAEPVIIGLLTLGFLGINRKSFGRALILMAFTLVLNRYLKSIWQIPLPPELNKDGWAFPSGHMQNTVALWGYLAWQYNKKWLYAILIPFWIIFGYALVHFGYHYPRDVYAAAGFGLASIIAYHLLLQLNYFKENSARIGIVLSIIGAILIALIPNGIKMETPLLGEGALLGFSLGWLIYNTKIPKRGTTAAQRIASIVVALLGIFIAYQLLSISLNLIPQQFAHFIFGFFLCFWVGGVATTLGNMIASPKTQSA